MCHPSLPSFCGCHISPSCREGVNKFVLQLIGDTLDKTSKYLNITEGDSRNDGGRFIINKRSGDLRPIGLSLNPSLAE